MCVCCLFYYCISYSVAQKLKVLVVMHFLLNSSMTLISTISHIDVIVHAIDIQYMQK